MFRNDKEVDDRQRLEKERRELLHRIDELSETVREEQNQRMRADKCRKELSEELEAYKLELEETQDKTAVIANKREEENAKLKVGQGTGWRDIYVPETSGRCGEAGQRARRSPKDEVPAAD